MAAIAGDEARHEKAYIKICDQFFRLCALRCDGQSGLCASCPAQLQSTCLNTT